MCGMSLYLEGRKLTEAEVNDWKIRFFFHVLESDDSFSPFFRADKFKEHHGISGPTRWGMEYNHLVSTGGLFELEMRRLINEN